MVVGITLIGKIKKEELSSFFYGNFFVYNILGNIEPNKKNMFTLLILIVTFVLTLPGIINGMKNNSDLKDLLFEQKFKFIGLIAGIIIAILQPFSLKKVDPATIALKVSLVGKRGIDDYENVSGWVFVNNATHDLVEIPKNLQNISYKEEKTFAKGGFPINISPTFNYKVNDVTAGNMYVELRKPLNEIEQGWLYSSLINAINETLNLYTVDYIFNNREKVEKEIENRAKEKTKRWFIIDQFKANLTPPPSLQNAVIKEAQAVKDAQAMTQVAIKEKASGEAKIAKAKADSAQRVINASAKSEEIKLLQKQLTKEYIELKRIEQWDGKYPTHVLGNNMSQILN